MKPKRRSILIVHEIPIREVKANLIQTLNMCYAFSQRDVIVKLLILRQIPEKRAIEMVQNIIEDYSKFFKIQFVEYKPRMSFFSSFDRFWRLKEYIDLSYEYIFTRSPLVSLYVTRKKKKLIYESHNAYFTRHKILNRYYRLKFKKIIKKESFKLFISISHNLTKYWVKNHILESKAISLHDGTSTKNTSISDDIKFPFQDNGRLKVIYTGSLYKDRGIERLLKLAKDFSNLDFLVVGGPDNDAEVFEKEAKELQLINIIFLGYVDHRYIPFYLSKSDILLALWSKSVPTINYCSPLKIFEYMNANKLIIADGFITIKEVLKDRENALLCQPDNYDSLKSKVQEVIDDKDLLKIGTDNKQLIEKKYSWKRRAELILERLY